MYEDYFNEIFKTSKSVIVPGLGSFSKASHDDPKTTFNPYLKFNDGFLAGFISKKLGISVDDAGRMIADNVERINNALDQKGEAEVLGLGALKKTGDGKLEFKSAVLSGGNGKGPEIDRPVEKPVVKPVEQPQPDIKPEIKPEPPAPEIKPEAPKPEIQQPETPVIQPNTDQVKNEAPITPGVKTVAPALTEVNNAVKDQASKKQEKAKTPKPPKAPKTPKPEGQKKKFPLVLVIVLVLLAGAGTFTALQWDMVKGWLGMGEHKETARVETQPAADQTPVADTLAVTPADTAATIPVEETPAPAETPVKEKPAKEKNPPVQHSYASSGQFHVIVNCFTSEQNASRMVEKLTAEGHQGNNLGQRGGYYMVEAGSFSTMEEARTKLETIKSTYPKAWIYAGS